MRYKREPCLKFQQIKRLICPGIQRHTTAFSFHVHSGNYQSSYTDRRDYTTRECQRTEVDKSMLNTYSPQGFIAVIIKSFKAKTELLVV